MEIDRRPAPLISSGSRETLRNQPQDLILGFYLCELTIETRLSHFSLCTTLLMHSRCRNNRSVDSTAETLQARRGSITKESPDHGNFRYQQQSQSQHSNSSHNTATSGPSQQSMVGAAQASPGQVAIPALKNPRTAEMLQCEFTMCLWGWETR